MSLLKNFVLVSCVAVALFGVLQTTANAVVLASWGLDENPTSGTAVCSNAAYNMTYSATGVSSATGYFGLPDRAAQFDGLTGQALAGGAGSAVATNNGIAYPNLNFTIEAFFKPTGNTSDGVGYIYGESAGGTGNCRTVLRSGWRGFGDQFCQRQRRSSGNIEPSHALVWNNWYFGALTCDNSIGGGNATLTVYLYDYSTSSWYTASKVIANTRGAGVNYAGISCQGVGGPTSKFDGPIDNVKIYNTALTEAQLFVDATTNQQRFPSRARWHSWRRGWPACSATPGANGGNGYVDAWI